MDAVCGGDWWRDVWLEKYPDKDASEDDKIAAEEAVVAGYADKLRERAGGAGTWVIDVRPRADLKPFYYLVFATRHIDGMLAFGESASLGPPGVAQVPRRAWPPRARCSRRTTRGRRTWKAQEALLKEQWVDTLAERLTAELAKGEAVPHHRPRRGDSRRRPRGRRPRRCICARRSTKCCGEGKTTTIRRARKDLLNLTDQARVGTGISSQSRPSSSRPLLFGVRPPHCLKKNATPCSRHSSRSSRTHVGSSGR